tara:strand:- start:55 stop:705 length:651 start_codon:yes stop_codon:yes gene_type:complete
MLQDLVKNTLVIRFPGQVGGDHFFWDTFDRAEFQPLDTDWCPPNCFHDGMYDVRGVLTVWREGGEIEKRDSIVHVSEKYFIEKVEKARAGEDGYEIEMVPPPPRKLPPLMIYDAAVEEPLEDIYACQTEVDEDDYQDAWQHLGEDWFEAIRQTEGFKYRFRIGACDGTYVTEWVTLMKALMIAASWHGYSLRRLALCEPICFSETWGSTYIEKKDW